MQVGPANLVVPERPHTPVASVILPVHDQADHIEGVVNSFLTALRGLHTPFEVILVSNGCRDESPAICARLTETNPEVRHLDLTEGGWGHAVKAGLREARGEILCYTNSARTRPEFLVVVLLYAKAYDGVVIKANRRIRDSAFRRLGSLLYNLQCRALFDLSVWDINGTPKVFPRKFGLLLELTRDDDLIDLELNVLCQLAGYPVIEIPILATVRHGAQATTNLRSAARMYWGAFQLWRRLREREGERSVPWS